MHLKLSNTINNLRYADDTTLLAESKKELKNILMKVKEESEKVSLNSMFKILQARLQQYMNHELPDVQADLEKAEEQRSNCQHPLDHQKSKRVPEKHLLLLY